MLLHRVGFSEINFFSMGDLDIDIIKQTGKKLTQNNKNSNFLNKFNNSMLQEFIKYNNISSHKWVIARK